MSRNLFLGIVALGSFLAVIWFLQFFSVGASANRANPTELASAPATPRRAPSATATARPARLVTPTRMKAASTPTLLPSPTPLPKVDSPDSINGVPVSSVIIIDEATRQNVREIYARGQVKGRDPRAFSKVGDSTMVWPPFTALFDDPTAFTLGPQYEYLQETIDQYRGSFAHISASAKKSMHSWSEFDPEWVNNPRCHEGEEPMACELRINNPSIVIIRLGANDVWAQDEYQKQMARIVDFWIDNGVIPVLGTKPDRLEGPQNTLNKMVAELARVRRIPFWDYDLIAGTVPGKGLLYDHVHFQAYGSHDYASPDAFNAADSLEDLTGLMMLDSIRRLTTRSSP